MARKKRGFEYQKELARRHGFDSYYAWRKAGYPSKPSFNWKSRQFTTAEALIKEVRKRNPYQVIRVDVWTDEYGDMYASFWVNVFAKGTVEEFLRRIDNHLLTIPHGQRDKATPKPYSLRWRIG